MIENDDDISEVEVVTSAVGDDAMILGIDISVQLLARARLRAEELLCEAEFRNADAAVFDDEDGLACEFDD